MDEVSTLGPTLAILVRDGGLERLVIEPGELGVAPPSPEDLGERGPRDSAALARRVLAGLERGACRDLVLINSAAALLAYGRVGDMEQGMRIAARSIDSGAAYRKLHDLTVLSRLAPREA
jgi:anthranilate phosphoribosyltransferase